VSACLPESLRDPADPVESPAALPSDEDARSTRPFEVERASPPDDPAASPPDDPDDPPDEASELDPEPSEPAPDGESPADESLADDDSLADESPADRDPARLALDRSFLAQPEPLKCTAGVATALRILPSAPHAGQNLGPSASIRWITSIRFRQAAQT